MNLSSNRELHSTMDSVLASHPEALGSIPDVPKKSS